jgi:DNA-binding transcriptional ArsR family regulator
MTGHSDAVFRSLADPTRRHILDLLAESGPLNVSQLSDEFPRLVTSGISKHLMSLRATRLVTATRRGRQQLYQLEPDALRAALAPWVAKYERYWSAALGRLRDLAEDSDPEEEHKIRQRVQRRRSK